MASCRTRFSSLSLPGKETVEVFDDFGEGDDAPPANDAAVARERFFPVLTPSLMIRLIVHAREIEAAFAQLRTGFFFYERRR